MHRSPHRAARSAHTIAPAAPQPAQPPATPGAGCDRVPAPPAAAPATCARTARRAVFAMADANGTVRRASLRCPGACCGAPRRRLPGRWRVRPPSGRARGTWPRTRGGRRPTQRLPTRGAHCHGEQGIPPVSAGGVEKHRFGDYDPLPAPGRRAPRSDGGARARATDPAAPRPRPAAGSPGRGRDAPHRACCGRRAWRRCRARASARLRSSG